MLGGRNIAEVLAMSVTEAEEFFDDGDARTPAAHKILDRLADVGLGYLSLGQPLTTLSGGERQRLKLATQMAEKGDVYVLDEPTTGLHLADVEQLARPARRLVGSGKSVIVIAHREAVMAEADWIVTSAPAPAATASAGSSSRSTRRPRRRPLHPHRRAPRGLRRAPDARPSRPSHVPKPDADKGHYVKLNSLGTDLGRLARRDVGSAWLERMFGVESGGCVLGRPRRP